MIGRTEFQNVSGTRCPTDFVELPSILMEKFLTHADSLALIARHHQTERPLAMEDLQRHLGASTSFADLETHDELMLSLLDQRLHSIPSESNNIDSTRLYEDVQKTSSILEPILGLDWQGRFSHLVSYPATYYAYPLDRALSTAIWEDSFASSPLSEKLGRAYKQRLLSHGGAREPRDSLIDFASSTPSASGRNRVLDLLTDLQPE
jgi:mitochondrial intermediate peptidase